MIVTPVTPGATPGSAPDAPVRRVRHQARDAVALMTFSAVTSIGFATALLLLAHLGR
ncbi:MAG: hypothetical protein Q8O61_06140 [Nocardioides sp.]|nr:hypothetical protein [Nocardioides sp.]